MKKNIIYFLSFLLILKIAVLDIGCANIVPPTGGPRDSLPPELVNVTPRDSSLRFNTNKISFYFNEYIDIQNLQENLIVSPTPKITPLIEFRLRTLTVQLKDTLEPNTTYSINFGNALRDINEGNILKDFTYVFSTGNKLDNNQLSGTVRVAETGRIDSTLTVLLHNNADDSAIVKQRPRYIARLNGNGNFIFRNLPSGTFYLYALKDEGGSLRYLSKAQLFAFADKPVVVDEKTQSVTLHAFIENAEEPRKAASSAPSSREKKPEDKRLRYQTSIENGQQDILGNFEITFASALKNFDSTKIFLADAKFQRIANYSFLMDSLRQKLTLSYSWPPDDSFRVVLDKDFAEDSLGRKLLKKDTLTFKTKKESDYGSLRVRFASLDRNRKPVLQFVQNDKILYSSPLNGSDFYRKLFEPGEYELRILYDENGNGRWDPGSFFGKHLQPEKVQAIEKKVTVKANWDNDSKVDP